MSRSDVEMAGLDPDEVMRAELELALEHIRTALRVIETADPAIAFEGLEVPGFELEEGLAEQAEADAAEGRTEARFETDARALELARRGVVEPTDERSHPGAWKGDGS